jgi:hypothetical protein
MRYVKGTQYLAINEKHTETRYLAIYDIHKRKATEGSILQENVKATTAFRWSL